MKYLNLHFLVILAIATLPAISSAQTEITAGNITDVRISADLDLLPSGGNNGDDNGGLDSKLIGLNLGNVENWALMGFDLEPLAGSSVVSATITVNIAPTPFNNSNHGDTADSFSIHELYAGNAGWTEGNRTIGQAVASQAGGAATFQNQSDVGAVADAGDIPWVDGDGANLENFIGAFDSTALNTNTVMGWDGPDTAPTQIEFDLDAATVQGWIDAGSVAGIVLTVTDDGSSTSRFNFAGGANNFNLNVTVMDDTVLVGDVNRDTVIDFNDIAPFITLLTMMTFQAEADINGDLAVDFSDIAPFIGLLLPTP